MSMLYVPAGQFEMGLSDDQVDRVLRVCSEAGGDCAREAYRYEQPAHTVTLDAFWIDQTEVTNAMFAAFLGERGNQAEAGVSWLEPGAGHRGIVYGHIDEVDGAFRAERGYEDHPVVEVSWYGAAAYCAWVGARLPSEAEWAYAARGPQAHVYPWGDAYEGAWTNACDARCSYRWRDTRYDDGAAEWTVVGSYPEGASWCGALDMSGNVWEWVNDWWSDGTYARSPTHDPQGPASGTLRIARGGSWFDEGWQVSAASRKALTPSSSRMHWVGFRCAASAGMEE
jgi:serine/threonine-protein kinase